MGKTKNVFQELNAISLNGYTSEKDNGRERLTYLSWTKAWEVVKSMYPDAAYSVRHWDGKPYLYDEHLGYMVETSVTIKGETIEMWLPVMNGTQRAMKAQPYEYATRMGKKTVEAATMTDINNAIMRCVVKNLAMFGLGLYIYAGEDIPDAAKRSAVDEMAACRSNDEIQAVWQKWSEECPSICQQGTEFYKKTIEMGIKFKPKKDKDNGTTTNNDNKGTD